MAALTLSIFQDSRCFTYYNPQAKLEQFSAWQYPTKTISSNLKVHYFGVSTLLFDDGENQILIDGFLVASHYLDETVGTLRPRVVIPIHWDNFFQPLARP